VLPGVSRFAGGVSAWQLGQKRIGNRGESGPDQSAGRDAGTVASIAARLTDLHAQAFAFGLKFSVARKLAQLTHALVAVPTHDPAHSNMA
jgi:hypothetical protein